MGAMPPPLATSVARRGEFGSRGSRHSTSACAPPVFRRQQGVGPVAAALGHDGDQIIEAQRIGHLSVWVAKCACGRGTPWLGPQRRQGSRDPARLANSRRPRGSSCASESGHSVAPTMPTAATAAAAPMRMERRRRWLILVMGTTSRLRSRGRTSVRVCGAMDDGHHSCAGGREGVGVCGRGEALEFGCLQSRFSLGPPGQSWCGVMGR